MNEVQICKGALYRVGSSVSISTLDENTERSETVRQSAYWYPIARDAVLQSAPWGFARKVVALATVTDTLTPGWSYAYEYPEDCLQAIAIESASGTRNSVYWAAYWPGIDVDWAPPKIPYQVRSRDGGDSNILVTDIAEAYGRYIFRQTVTATFSALFVDALQWKLGADLGQALQVKDGRVDRCINMYERTLSRAMAQMLNEEQPDRERESPSITVRGW